MILVLLGVKHSTNFLLTIFDVIPLKVSQITPISLTSQHTWLASRRHLAHITGPTKNAVTMFSDGGHFQSPGRISPTIFSSKLIDGHRASPALPLPTGYATDTTTAAAHIVLTPRTDADA